MPTSPPIGAFSETAALLAVLQDNMSEARHWGRRHLPRAAAPPPRPQPTRSIHHQEENPMASDQTLALMQLMDDIKRPHGTYWRAFRRAQQTFTDSPENEAAQARGNSALLEIEQAVRAWVAKHPEVTTEPEEG